MDDKVSGSGIVKLVVGNDGMRKLGFSMSPSAVAAAGQAAQPSGSAATGGDRSVVVHVARSFANAASAESAIRVAAGAQSAGIVGVPPTGAPFAASAKEAFALVAFLITKGRHDALHESYLECHLDLDQSANRTLLFTDIGNPQVRGPVVRELIERGILSFDPSEREVYERAVAEAGGEKVYRRQQIDRLTQHFGLQAEPRPLLLVVSTTHPDARAILPIPEAILWEAGGSARLWEIVEESLAEPVLRTISLDTWDAASMSMLQDHLDALQGRLGSGNTSLAGASLVDEGDGFVITFAGTVQRVRAVVGLRDLRHVLSAPRNAAGAAVVDMLDLWRAHHAGSGARVGAVSSAEARSFAEEGHGESGGLEKADRKTIQQVKQRYEALMEQRTSAERDEKFDLAEEIDERLTELTKYLGQTTRSRGRLRVGGDQQLRGIEAVRKAIGRAIEAVSKVHPKAGQHLASFVQVKDFQVSYMPTPPVTWRT